MAEQDKNFSDALDGDQPVQGDDHAAAALAQGNPKAGAVPQAWNMKDQSSAGQKYTGR
jgi:hypothetical protein